MQRLEAILGRAYELSAQILNDCEADIALAEEVCGETAELLAHINGDRGAFESEEVMDAELVKLTKVINLLDKATTIIYNMEGDLFQANYDKLEAILDSFRQAEV
jgi:hypothetical protein